MAVEVVAVNGAKSASIFALTAQHHERLERYDFDNGQFSSRILFQANTPLWGGLGMRVVDIDKDGDLDILHWNGDTLDAPKVAPWQGVHLLENTGDTYRKYQLASFRVYTMSPSPTSIMMVTKTSSLSRIYHHTSKERLWMKAPRLRVFRICFIDPTNKADGF